MERERKVEVSTQKNYVNQTYRNEPLISLIKIKGTQVRDVVIARTHQLDLMNQHKHIYYVVQYNCMLLPASFQMKIINAIYMYFFYRLWMTRMERYVATWKNGAI